MKKMTCLQLGGACNQVFEAATFEEIAEQSKNHGIEMYQSGDQEHLEAMNKMRSLMQKPGAMEEWMSQKKKEFDALPES